jgi:hypothetical protein
MRHERIATVWEPEWEGAIKNWATSFIKKQQWRCDKIYEFEDLLQEAYVLFLKLAARYPRVVEPAHFMALFKTSLSNFIHDKSIYLQRKKECHVDVGVDISDFCISHIGETTNAGLTMLLLNEAPQELRLALALVTDDPASLGAPINPRKPRENLNMKLRRILGLENTFDFKAALIDLLLN